MSYMYTSILTINVLTTNCFKDKAIPNDFHDDCWPQETLFSLQPIELIPDQWSVQQNKNCVF